MCYQQCEYSFRRIRPKNVKSATPIWKARDFTQWSFEKYKVSDPVRKCNVGYVYASINPLSKHLFHKPTVRLE